MELSRSVSCGAWGCRPRWLQRFATPRGFLWVYGLLGTTQTMAYLYFVATLTTMERRFKIPSKTTGIMLSGNEISQILLSLLLTYFGGRGNRPRWIAWGVAISAISCFILALPHAMYGPGSLALSLTKEHGTTFTDTQQQPSWDVNNASFLERTSERSAASPVLCGIEDLMAPAERAEEEAEACIASHDADTQDGNYSMVPILLVFLSQFVLGIGTTLYYALGQIYLDDNSRKGNTPALLGMTLALRTLGPALGFALGFACLNIYVDPWLTPIIDKKDPRWIGAWWLGWLLLGATMLMFAGIISLFPRRLPPAAARTKNKIVKNSDISEKPAPSDRLLSAPIESNKKSDHDDHEKPSFKEFPVALRRLLSNKLLMYNIMSSVFYILGASGYITFSTKYMEVQYNQSAAGASMLAGTGGLMAMVLGFLVSGLVISKYKPAPKYLLFWNVIAGSCYIVAETIFIFIGCPDHQIHGASPTGTSLELISDCNTACNCPSDLHFSPVCINNLTFFSPCHAGCMGQMQQTLSSTARNLTFSSCKCASDAFSSLTNSSIDLSSVIATDGACVPNCNMLIPFIVLTCFMHMVGSSARIGNILVNFRCVEPRDKAFAQGMALAVISLFSFIPGPIIFGSIIDSTCLIWNESCGRRGNCALYSKSDFRLYMNATAASITTIAVMLDLVVWHKGKNLDLYGEDSKPKEAQTNNKR